MTQAMRTEALYGGIREYAHLCEVVKHHDKREQGMHCTGVWVVSRQQWRAMGVCTNVI